MRSQVFIPALGLLLACAPGFTAAQEITGTITGTVTDQKGAVLPGVTVSLKNTRSGLTKDVVTNAKGAYTASFLAVGRYEVTFALSAFETRTATGIALKAGDRRELDMVLAAAVTKKPSRSRPRPSPSGLRRRPAA